MKMVVAVIQPYKLEEVKNALREISVQGMTVIEVRGFGQQHGHSEVYRGHEYQVDLIPKIRLEIACEDSISDRIVDVIERAARTGKIGDGKIFVIPAEHVVRIRTGETGSDAL